MCVEWIRIESGINIGHKTIERFRFHTKTDANTISLRQQLEPIEYSKFN